ncbi:hypothetical protein [Sphingomonas beigongshangi]|jgi:hypothetical protein|uniref:hypothetical protein n=1 Tax=Sphingomonas beigongshangi TaxID=2782540 RepID=UPI001AEF1796|nr:hypothetical protein [Sphingomonas beigongshangi]
MLLLAFAAAVSGTCGLSQPQACATTADLIAAPGVVEGIRAATAGQRANLLRDGLPPVAEQALAVLGGPGDKPREIAGGWLFTACRKDACGEKGALIVAGGKIVAVGVVHGACAVERQRPGCARRLSLSLYGGDPVVRYRRAVADWADAVSDAGRLPVYDDGVNEPVVTLQGDFDGDRLPDTAALVGVAAGMGYRLVVQRGADPDHRAVVAQQIADPSGFDLAQGDGGTLRFGRDTGQVARWAGDRYVVAPAR